MRDYGRRQVREARARHALPALEDATRQAERQAAIAQLRATVAEARADVLKELVRQSAPAKDARTPWERAFDRALPVPVRRQAYSEYAQAAIGEQHTHVSGAWIGKHRHPGRPGQSH